jgi:hypothetical protein
VIAISDFECCLTQPDVFCGVVVGGGDHGFVNHRPDLVISIWWALVGCSAVTCFVAVGVLLMIDLLCAFIILPMMFMQP